MHSCTRVPLVLALALALLATIKGEVLLYSTANEIRLRELGPGPGGGANKGRAGTVIKGIEDGHALDVYYKGQTICWTDNAAGTIECATFNGTTAYEKKKVVTSGLNTPNGLAIDWYTEKLYWTDEETTRIEVASLNGNHRKVLFWSDIDRPRAIAVAPMKGLLFWTDWGEMPKIERAGMNGDPATRHIIVTEHIFWPNGLTIDYDKNQIYWLDAKLKFIDVMDFDGKNRKTIVKDGLAYAYALTLFNMRLYWTDWETWYIHSWDMATKGPIKDILRPGVVPIDIRVWDPKRQPSPVVPTLCQNNNGNCSHICLLSPLPPGYSCACPTGVKLISKYECANGPQTQLILASRKAIHRISLDTPDYTSFPLPIHGIKHAIGVDYDPVDGFIYWTDDLARTISKVHMDGSNQSVVIQGELETPDGLAVDNVARNIYWIDPSAGTISIARLDGSSRKVLINEDLNNPRAIALAPSLGWMFWSDWYKKKPKIERASLDGSDRTLLVSDGLGWPNGIALDIKAQKLYWGDAFTHKIEVCNMDGTDRRELISDNLNHIFGLTLLGDYLYWTDWQVRSLSKVHKITGDEREVLVEQLPDIMGLKAFEIEERVTTNPCSFNNGNCSHLCFNRPTDFVCGCPIGLELRKDNQTCVKPSAFLLYAKKDKIGRLSIENLNNDAFLPVKDVKDVCALAIHVSESRLYWADTKSKNIARCAINGSNTEKVIEWTNAVEGLAIDWLGNNLYWTDSQAQRIEVSKLNGSNRRALLWQGLRKPKSIALDPAEGYMYWSEWGSKSIKRAAMDGSSPTILLDQVGRANAITIDTNKKSLYWVTLEPAAIESSNLNGSNRKKLISENIKMPFALTLYQNFLYWADWTTGDIERASVNSGLNRSRIYSKLEFISDMVVYHYTHEVDKNPCLNKNGGCSHLCIPMPRSVYKAGFKCACPTHYTLNDDALSCSPPIEFIMFSQRNGIGRVIIGGSECPDALLPLTGLRMVRAIEFDPLYRHLYWIDRGQSIKRIHENGLGTPVSLITGLSNPFDMALDSIGRVVFWSCAKSNTINVTKLDNASSVGVVVQGEGLMPRHIALHQYKRLLFWADIGVGAVMSSGLDGAERYEVAKAPNISALAVDPYTDTVYWANSKQIHASALNGERRRIIWQGGVVMYLAVLSGTLYWIDGDRQLMHLPLNRKDAPAHPVLHVPHITDVLAVYKMDMKNPCMGGGGCSGVCLADGVCGCARGLSQGSGNVRCGPPPPCGPHYFTCTQTPSAHSSHVIERSQSRDCIPIAWRCDGQVDCNNGSDEADCNSCPGKFKCRDEQCIDESFVCDGVKHCLDGSDEANCCNGPHNFQCPGTGVCIPAKLLCDRWENCADGADELPSFCAQRRIDNPPSNVKLPYIIIIIVTVGVVFFIGWVIYFCRRRILTNRHFPTDDTAGDPLSPKQIHVHKPSTICPSSSNVSRQAKSGIKLIEGMRMSTLNGSSSSYDRNHITGASSSITNGSSRLSRYPQEPLNPPPSPATTTPSISIAPRHRPYRHYRHINQPPPPTPCSTDVCDESDCTISYPMLGPGLYLEAPPPTPCPPTPPSPSSRSSTYFSPLPPPPSPVPHQYDS